MKTLDLVFTVKISSNDDRVKITPEKVDKLLDELKENYVDTEYLSTSIEITEKVTNKHIVYHSKSD